jgi:hypothetical protein
MRNVCSSSSFEDSIEHIFCPIPTAGRYKIRVYYRHQFNEPVQSYGLAWWTVPQKAVKPTMNEVEESQINVRS